MTLILVILLEILANLESKNQKNKKARIVGETIKMLILMTDFIYIVQVKEKYL